MKGKVFFFYTYIHTHVYKIKSLGAVSLRKLYAMHVKKYLQINVIEYRFNLYIYELYYINIIQ